MKRLRRLLLLPAREKLLLAQSLFLVILIRFGLSIFPFRWIDRWLGVFAAPVDDHNRETNWNLVKSIVRVVRASSRYVPYASCLTQALAARVLLRMAGQSSHLKIGVERGSDNKFGAHSWVEVDGRVVIGKLPDHRRFSVLESNSAVI
jgi:hypothetical protein